MSWKAILEGKIFYFFFHLRGVGWVGQGRDGKFHLFFLMTPSLIYNYSITTLLLDIHKKIILKF